MRSGDQAQITWLAWCPSYYELLTPHNLESEESQLGSCHYQVALWACPWEIVVVVNWQEKGPVHCRQWAGSCGLCKEAGPELEQARKLRSSMVCALPPFPNFPQCLLYCDLEANWMLLFSQGKKGNQSTQHVPFAGRVISPARHVTVFVVPSFVLILEYFHISDEQSHKNVTWHFSSHKYSESFKHYFLFVRKNTFWGRVSRRPGWPQIHP